MPKPECATYTEVLSAQTILLAGASYSFRNQELAVVGGGDTAVEEAIYLTKYGTMVSLHSGLTRLCSILEDSCPGLPCSQAMLVHQGRVDTVRHKWDQSQVDHELCVDSALPVQTLCVLFHVSMQAGHIACQSEQRQGICTAWHARQPSQRKAFQPVGYVGLDMDVGHMQVHLLARGEKLRASRSMQDRALDHKKVTVHFNTTVDDAYPDGKGALAGLHIKDTKTGQSVQA